MVVLFYVHAGSGVSNEHSHALDPSSRHVDIQIYIIYQESK